MMPRGPFTPDEDEYIVANYRTMSYGQIAKHLHRDMNVVNLHARDVLGIMKKKETQERHEDLIRQYSVGHTCQETAALCGLSYDMARDTARKSGIHYLNRRDRDKSPFTPKQRVRLLRSIRDGDSLRRASDECGRTQSQTWKETCRMFQILNDKTKGSK